MSELENSRVGHQRWLIILPACFIMYTISFFDRANIGMALPHIAKDLGLTPVEAGWIGGAFAWGYAITQIGAGYLALRFHSRLLIGACLLLFGGAAILTGVAHTFHELLAIRFFLGLAEGPIYATTSMFLAKWFMKTERGRAFGIWNLAVPAGGFLAGPISGAILAHYDWRIMMIVEGLPAWIFCIVWFFTIPRNLESAKWLSAADREVIQRSLQAEQAAYQAPATDPWWTILSERAVWLLTLGFGLNGVLLYGTTLWLPTVMKSYGGLSEVMIGVYSGAPFVMSMFGIYYITSRSDKHGQERRMHAAVPTILTGLSMIAAAFVPVSFYPIQIALFMLAGFTLKMLTPLVAARVMEMLPTRKAVPAVAIVIGVGNLIGQFCGPLIVGYLKSISQDFTLSLAALGTSAVIGGVLIMASRTKEERIRGSLTSQQRHPMVQTTLQNAELTSRR